MLSCYGMTHTPMDRRLNYNKSGGLDLSDFKEEFGQDFIYADTDSVKVAKDPQNEEVCYGEK